MSKDYIGPFGPEQQAAAAETLDRLYRSGAGISDEAIVACVLSAAVGAFDREALVEVVMLAIRDAPAGYGPHGFARAAIESLFPRQRADEDEAAR